MHPCRQCEFVWGSLAGRARPSRPDKNKHEIGAQNDIRDVAHPTTHTCHKTANACRSRSAQHSSTSVAAPRRAHPGDGHAFRQARISLEPLVSPPAVGVLVRLGGRLRAFSGAGAFLLLAASQICRRISAEHPSRQVKLTSVWAVCLAAARSGYCPDLWLATGGAFGSDEDADSRGPSRSGRLRHRRVGIHASSPSV